MPPRPKSARLDDATGGQRPMDRDTTTFLAGRFLACAAAVLIAYGLIVAAFAWTGRDLTPLWDGFARLEKLWYALGGLGGVLAAYRVLRDRPQAAATEVAARREIPARLDRQDQVLAQLLEQLQQQDRPTPTPAPSAPVATSPPTGPMPAVADQVRDLTHSQTPWPPPFGPPAEQPPAADVAPSDQMPVPTPWDEDVTVVRGQDGAPLQ